MHVTPRHGPGDDADTVAAVTGQLAGAHYGASRIPDRWVARLHRSADIETLALCLRQDATGRTGRSADRTGRRPPPP